MEVKKTLRGFDKIEFKDELGFDCSLQDTSCTKSCVWLGTQEDRMCLTKAMVVELMSHLQNWLERKKKL